MDIQLPQQTLQRVVMRLCAVVVGLGALAALWLAAKGPDGAPVAVFFSLSYEVNFPNWFSSVLLAGCACLLALAAVEARQRGDAYRRHWWGLALGFAYISLDEVVQLHELTNRWFDLHGVFFFGWVIPAGLIVAVLGLCYLRFLSHLPAETRRDFVRAGVVYVGGALGVEVVLGMWTDRYGTDNLGYAFIDLIEESMEIFGAALFLCALTRYLARPDGVLRVAFGSPSGSTSAVRPLRRPGDGSARDRVAAHGT
jgi:hypothetical protein